MNEVFPGSDTGAQARQSRGYANATAVLPADLLAQLQQHHTGLLWIPAVKTTAKRRDLVVTLHGQGLQAGAIAVLAGISIRRVQQIVAEDRQSSSSSKPINQR
jgi:hypothetical protein